MNIDEFMAMSVAARTDFLEQIARTEGLASTSGVRTESELLLSVLARINLPDGPYHRDPDLIPKTLWGHYLKAPLLLLRMVTLFHPHLLKERKPLRVLYLGADRDEVLDEGRWFDFAWTLLDVPCALSITAVGPALAQSHTWETSAWRDMIAALPAIAELLPGTLQETMSHGDGFGINWEEHFDLVVMNHPGFVANMESWTADDAWSDLAGFAKVPIIGTSFDAVDFAFDRRGLAASGRIVDKVAWNSAAHINPGCVENQHCTRLQWGGVVWSTQMDSEITEERISAAQRDALEWIRKHHHPILANDYPLTRHLRWMFTCPMQFDDLHTSVWLTDDIRIHCDSGDVEAFDQCLPATSLTRQVTVTKGLEERLLMAPRLIKELGSRLDMDLVDETVQARRNNEADLPEHQEGWESDYPSLNTLVSSLHGADLEHVIRLLTGTDVELPDQSKTTFTYGGLEYVPVGALEEGDISNIQVPFNPGLQIDLDVDVDLACFVGADEYDLDVSSLFLTSIRITKGDEPLAFVGVQAFDSSDGFYGLDETSIPKGQLRDWLSRLLDDADYFNAVATKTWGLDSQWLEEESGTVANIERVWIAPAYRTDTFLAFVIEYARNAVLYLGGACSVNLSMSLCTIDQGIDSEQPNDCLEWLDGAIHRLGAVLAPLVDHGFDFTGEHEPSLCEDHGEMVFLPPSLQASLPSTKH